MRPKLETRVMKNAYFDFPLDPLKPIPVRIVCDRCKRTMFYKEIAPDANVVVFKDKCSNCCKLWSIRVRMKTPSGRQIIFTPDERIED